MKIYFPEYKDTLEKVDGAFSLELLKQAPFPDNLIAHGEDGIRKIWHEQRKKNAEISIHQIELEMDDVLNRKSKGFVWLDYFTEHQNIEKLTREVVVSLIREIKVFDKNHIEVIFDFDDCYKSYIRCGVCGKGLYKYGNKSSYRCHNGHVSRIRGEELKSALLDIARNMALAQLQEFELKTDGGNCPDNLEREIESLKKSKAHYAKLKFEIYDDYTKANITRDQMAKKTAEVKQKIAEIESLITQKQETLDMQKDLFLDAKQEQLTKLSKLDEFDEEVIRYLIDYVLVYDNEHIEIRWNFDDFQAG